jgi:hypothetical protein
MQMIMNGSPKGPKNEQQAAGHRQSSPGEVVREFAVMGYSNKRAYSASSRRSFLFDRGDVALPALKMDPDTELARVVPAEVEVRQGAGPHDVECSCDDRF